MAKQTTACALVLMLGAWSTQTSAQLPRRDGNWWRTLSATQKNHLVVGIFDGLELGRDLSLWDVPNNATGESVKAAATKSFVSLKAKYFSKIVSTQVSDGLDALYEDFRNRSIMLDRGIWLVANQIAGIPDTQLQKMIELHRQNAGVVH